MSGSRRSGALLHISSLPGAWGIGDLGKNARLFADFLRDVGFSIWQTLPLTPVQPIFGNSPYSSPSAFAGNTLLISPEELCKEGLVSSYEAAALASDSGRNVDFTRAADCREALLSLGWRKFNDSPKDFPELKRAFEKFRETEAGWLRDYALFTVLKDKNGGKCWTKWPKEFAFRDRDALTKFAAENEEAISFVEFAQFIFYRQLEALVAYCSGLGITLMGDIPIYVAADGADVWAQPELFDLEESGEPRCVAGVPPDYFSATGQRWGNPLYKWEAMKADNFKWWRARLAHTKKYCGMTRIDHFRGLCGYWEIPASEKTAQIGRWRPALGREMLEAFSRDCDGGSQVPLVAEDLGVITDDVRELMEDYSLPGMKVLMFAFSGGVATNPYAPHNITPRSVVYTGTHDNDTAVGWWNGTSTEEERECFKAYTGLEVTEANIAEIMTHMALTSVADTAIIQVQDILGLEGSCRMNLPSKTTGNWEWRLLPEELEALASKSDKTHKKLSLLNRLCGRSKQ